MASVPAARWSRGASGSWSWAWYFSSASHTFCCIDASGSSGGFSVDVTSPASWPPSWHTAHIVSSVSCWRPRRRRWRRPGAARSPIASGPPCSSSSPSSPCSSSRSQHGLPIRRRSTNLMPKRYKDIAGDGGSNIERQVSEQHARLHARLAEVRAIVAVVSGKGGVGKSSLTANLAACWALEGRRVGVLDADLNGPSMATMLGVLLLDLPPGTDRLVTVASLLPTLSGTIVVTIPSEVAHLVVRKSITIAAQAKAPVLGLVENMAGLFPGPSGIDLAREAGIPFLGAVPFDPALAAAADLGEPLVASAPTCEAARALTAIARTVAAAPARAGAPAPRAPRPA